MNNIILHADDYGRSPSISKSIYKCIKSKTITSISIIVSEKIYGLNYIKKNKVKKRLHINLTDFSPNLSEKSFLYNLTFVKLLFMPLSPNFNSKKLSKMKFLDKLKNIKKHLIKKKYLLMGINMYILYRGY